MGNLEYTVGLQNSNNSNNNPAMRLQGPAVTSPLLPLGVPTLHLNLHQTSLKSNKKIILVSE